MHSIIKNGFPSPDKQLMNRTLQTNLPNITKIVTQLTTGKSCYVHKLPEPNDKFRTEFMNHCLRIDKIIKILIQPCSYLHSKIYIHSISF